jgi:peptidyl-dipeptidase A
MIAMVSRLGGFVVLGMLLVSAVSCAGAPTADEAAAFADRAESELLELWIAAERASWVQSNFITDDTELIAADALKKLIAHTMSLAAQSTRFDDTRAERSTSSRPRVLWPLRATLPSRPS